MASENNMPEVVRLLHEVDGQLGLAIHRGEGTSEQWKQEASALIIRIRQTIKALESGEKETSDE